VFNYRQLHYFQAVAKSGGIARAAEQLHLTPQTLSGQIGQLEDRLGVELFRRAGRRLELTEAGRLALSYADEIFQVGGELEEALRNWHAERPFLFRVGIADVVPKSVAYRLLAPALALPEQVRMVCREDKLERLLAELAVHRLDMVVADSPMPPGMDVKGYSHRLGECGTTFLAAPALAATLEGEFPQLLDRAPLLIPGEDSALRAPLLRWLSACAADPDGSPLRIATLDERDVALRHRTIAPLRMVVGDGAHQLAWSDKRPAPLATSETETSSHALYRDIAGGAARNAARERPARMLWLEFDDGIDDPPADAAVLTDLPLARAMRIGATKSVLLTETGDGSVEKPRTVDARYRRGRRPVLPCRHRPPLDAGLRLLERYDRETASLRSIDADDAPPALLVVCEDPYWRRAVVAYAHAHGVGNALICDEGNVAQQVRARVLIDTLPPQHAAMQGRFCAVVVLREGGSHDVEDIDAGRLLAPALAPRWRDAAFAELKAEDRERIADGRSPCGLIDMLPAIASHWAAHWPANGARGAQQHPGLPYARARDLPTSTGDMCVVGLREAYRDFDFALPDPATAHLRASSMLSAQPHRRMRASCSMPVRKCVYTHQGWTKRSDGMERGLIEMAEDDPHVAAFCLFDATRHPWPVAAERPLVADAPTDATLADAPPACPHALIRTTGYVYVVQFAPALPLRTAADIEPPGVGAARDAMAAWCRRVNALPGDRRQYREWRPVQVQAPLFWSWKRRGGSLSSLLSALAETTPITTQRPRLAQPLDGAL